MDFNASTEFWLDVPDETDGFACAGSISDVTRHYMRLAAARNITKDEQILLFADTWKRCMPQATIPFYKEIFSIKQTSSTVTATVLLFNEQEAEFTVMKPDVVGCYGFQCDKNGGPPFEWKNGRWVVCSE